MLNTILAQAADANGDARIAMWAAACSAISSALSVLAVKLLDWYKAYKLENRADDEQDAKQAELDSKITKRQREAKQIAERKDHEFLYARYEKLVDDMHRELALVRDESSRLQREFIAVSSKCAQLEANVKVLTDDNARKDGQIKHLTNQVQELAAKTGGV